MRLSKSVLEVDGPTLRTHSQPALEFAGSDLLRFGSIAVLAVGEWPQLEVGEAQHTTDSVAYQQAWNCEVAVVDESMVGVVSTAQPSYASWFPRCC